MPNEICSAKVWFRDFMKRDGAVEQAAQFCKVKAGAILSWQDEIWPRGEQMYRLWALLELNGYKVEELESLPPPSHRLALLMACDVCSYDEVREELGYGDIHSIYRLLRNETTPSGDKVRRLEKLLEVYEPQLAEFIQYFTPLGPIKSGVVHQDDTERHDVLRRAVSLAAPAVVDLDECSTSSVPKAVAPGPDASVDFTVRLLQQVVRRVDRVDLSAFASRVKQEIPAQEIEKIALLLLELV